MPKKTKGDIVLKIANSEITVGDVLEVVPKPDLNAPSGFRKHGTSKLLMKGIQEVHSVPYDEEIRLWNTGFDEEDAVNRNLSKANKSTVVKSYVDNILKPYASKYRTIIDNTKDEFWGTYLNKIYTGRRFDTKNPSDLFDLFNALKQGHICEPNEKDPYLQRKANYNIKNIVKMQSLEDERAETKFEAAATFKTMLDSFDPKKDDSLYSILEWINVPNIRGGEKDVIKKAMIKQFNNEKLGYENSRRFLEACNMAKDKSTRDVMDIFTMLSKLSYNRKIRYERRQYYLGDILLGNHLKEAANKAVMDTELRGAIEDAYKEVAN